jgi:hypothetical protein
MAFEVGLTPSQIVEAVRTHPGVRESKERYPYPPPPWGAPLLLVRAGDSVIEVRHYAGPLMPRSPVMRILMEPTKQGTDVRVDFRGVPPLEEGLWGWDQEWKREVHLVKREDGPAAVLASMLVVSTVCALAFGPLGIVGGALLGLFLYMFVASAAEAHPVREPKSPPAPKGEAIAPELFTYFGLQRYGPRFRELIGDVLVRNRLQGSDETDPYRRQLGPGSDRWAA